MVQRLEEATAHLTHGVPEPPPALPAIRYYFVVMVFSADSPGMSLHLGLCAACRHAHYVENDRGSTFLRCELSLTDPRFPKYPRLPVLACDGYRKADPPEPA